MKTFTIKKAVLATALTLVPALALTSAAQAAPAYRSSVPAYRSSAPVYRAPVAQHNNTASGWNNLRPELQPRYEVRSNQNQRFEPRYDQYQNPREQTRFEPRHEDNRFESRHDNDRNRGKDNDTGKIIGAGIVGAILGAVLSR